MVSHVGKGLWSKVCLNCTGTYGRLAYEIPDIMYTLDLLVSSRQQYRAYLHECVTSRAFHSVDISQSLKRARVSRNIRETPSLSDMTGITGRHQSLQ